MSCLNLTTKIWPDLFKLDNKVVVVTGAGLIGSVIIKGLVEAGAKVIIGEIDEKIGKKLEMKFKEENYDVIFKKLDITNENLIDLFLKECVNELNVINGWVNTAYPKTKEWGKTNISNYNLLKKNMEMHLGGYYLTTIKIAEIMKKQGFGSIINFGSIYGVSAPDFSIYEGTHMKMPIDYAIIKGGINMLTKYIASNYGKYNIRANIVAPGGVFDNQPDQFVKNYEKKVPLKRMATPEDIAGPVIFLISDASSYITGQIIMVDGGWTIW